MLYQVHITFWESNKPKHNVIELDVPVNLLELELNQATELIHQSVQQTNWKYFDVDVVDYWIN